MRQCGREAVQPHCLLVCGACSSSPLAGTPGTRAASTGRTYLPARIWPAEVFVLKFCVMRRRPGLGKKHESSVWARLSLILRKMAFPKEGAVPLTGRAGTLPLGEGRELGQTM